MFDLLSVDEIIEVRAKHYAGDSRIPRLANLADEFLGSKIQGGNNRNYAIALQVCHWLTLSDRVEDGNLGTGAVIEEKEGELTIKYSSANNIMAFTSDWKADLDQTVYGKELYTFCKKFFITVLTRL